jgi:hypothetical protein
MKTTKPSSGRYRVTWGAYGAIKSVQISDRATGVRVVGKDWASWDVAYQQALWQLPEIAGSSATR